MTKATKQAILLAASRKAYPDFQTRASNALKIMNADRAGLDFIAHALGVTF